jgi:hypothetical protein
MRLEFEGESHEPFEFLADESDTEGESDEQYGGQAGDQEASDTEGDPDEQYGRQAGGKGRQ